MKDPRDEGLDILRVALEEIERECSKYREFEVVKLIRAKAALALQDAEVCMRSLKED